MNYYLSVSADGVSESPGAVRVPMNPDGPTELHAPFAGPPVLYVLVFTTPTGGDPIGVAPMRSPMEWGDSILLEQPVRITEH